MNCTIQFSIEDCIYCGFQFGLPKSFIRRKKDDHEFFYCPSCKGSMHWPQLSEKEKLTRQLKNVQECCVEYEDKANSLERSQRALKGHLTRLKKA